MYHAPILIVVHQDLLKIPYLNQFQCNDPDKPSEKIDIQTMVTTYQKVCSSPFPLVIN
jgi:hypothetical protein